MSYGPSRRSLASITDSLATDSNPFNGHYVPPFTFSPCYNYGFHSRATSSAFREISPAGRSSQSTRSDFSALISPGLIRDMSGEIYGRWMKGNEWAPRPISAKTAPVSTNRAVNFGYRAILLFCQSLVWWKNWRKSGWRLDFVFLTSMNASHLQHCLNPICQYEINFDQSFTRAQLNVRFAHWKWMLAVLETEFQCLASCNNMQGNPVATST